MLTVFSFRVPAQAYWNELMLVLKAKIPVIRYQKVACYKHEGTVLRHLLGELMVREISCQRFGWSKEECVIERGVHGKPYLKGAESLFFNISHSGEWLICAFSDREVGVDIEWKGRPKLEIACRFFHIEEVEWLKKMNEENQGRLFYDLWAIKESFLKYTGEGLTRALNSFRVKRENLEYVLYREDEKIPLFVRACHVDPAYACFVCSDTGETPRLEEFKLDDFL